MLMIKDKDTCSAVKLLSLCMLTYESLIYYQIADLFKRITQIRAFNDSTKSICENCSPFSRAPLIFKAWLNSFAVGLPLNIT